MTFLWRQIMIRSIIDIILIVVFFIITIPLLFILWLISLVSVKTKDAIAYPIMKGAFAIILFSSGVKVKVEGIENIPKDRSVLYVGNHRSYFDIIVAYKNVVSPTGFIAKKEFTKVPVLYHWIACLHGIFIDRKNVKEGLKSILEAIENVKSGISYFIFPEGTRNHNEEMLPFKEGSFKIATKSGCPIVPVAMKHMDEIFELHQPYVKKTNVTIRYGEPIYMENLSKDELKFIGKKVQNVIADMIAEME